MFNDKFFILFVLFCVLWLAPSDMLACKSSHASTVKSCCQKESSNTDKKDCCCKGKKDAKNKKKNCGDDCGQNSCHCSTTSTSFLALSFSNYSENGFLILTKSINSHYLEIMPLGCFIPIWTPPNIG